MSIDKGFGGIVPSLSANQILEAIPDLHSIATIETIEYGHYPGPHITPDIMFDLAQRVQYTVDQEHIDGIIITHGTDTLEETAFFSIASLIRQNLF